MVDDNPINLAVARGFLKNLGYEVETATDGIEAVNLFDINKYDCILMDIHMPKMSGLEASLAIREIEEKANSFSLPIVAFTADVFIEDECLQASKIQKKILKPLRNEELKSLLENLFAA